jgi:predicted DNA-binding transcriptional regulator AlpA
VTPEISPARIGLSLPEAAKSIGVSLSTFRRRVLPTLRTVKLGRAIVVRPDDLDEWLENSGTLNTPYN